MVLDDVLVAVPAPLVLHAAAVDLHEAHAALDQPPGDQALPGEVRALRIVEAVERLRRPRFAFEVEAFGGRHLHAIGQLETFDPGGQLRLVRRLLEVPLVELLEEVELRALLAVGDALRRIQVVDRRALRLEHGPLVDARQKARAPVRRVPLGQAAAQRVVHDDEAGQAAGSRSPGRTSPTSRRRESPSATCPC